MSRRRARKGRPVHGILLLDKPLNMTSNQALQRAKRLFNAQKAGHTGSLDPMASGLLPLCFGEATKVSAYLLDANKRYVVEGVLGQATDTADAAGEVIRECALPTLNEAGQRTVIEGFIGESQQIPPMYSALRVDGKRLHELARAGEEVERAPRRIVIHSIDIIALRNDYLKLEVSCSKGTYIRTLIEDIAAAMGSCGHVHTLRRSAVSCFDGSEMTTLDELEQIAEQDPSRLDQLLLPLDAALFAWPEIRLDPVQEEKVLHGQSVIWEQDSQQTLRRLYDSAGDFIGIAALADGSLRLKRMIRPHRESHS